MTVRIDAFAGTDAESAFGSLNVRASDLVLTLGGVWIGGEPVFPSRLAGTEALMQAEADTPVY